MIQKSPCESLGVSKKYNAVFGIDLYALARQQGMIFGF